jgi:hypothetical protein
MAYSRSYTPGDSETTDFVLGFDYLTRDHIKVFVDGVQTTAWSWLNASTIRFNTAPATGAVVLIRRYTSPEQRLVDYESPSPLNETDLDTDSLQAFYLAQEANDQANAGIADDPSTGQFSANDKRITNVSDPVDDDDAATKGWAETAMTSQLAQAIAAKDAAKLSELDAEAAAVSTLADRNAVSNDKSAVALDRLAVAADKSTVAADKVTTEGYKNAAASSASAASTSASTASSAASTATTQAGLAGTAKTGAETARTGSEAARTGSEAARDKAEEWAEKAEDSPVETGRFSAKHWAAKAQAYAAAMNLPGITGADYRKVLLVDEFGNWDVDDVSYHDLTDKPTLGSMASRDIDGFREQVTAPRIYYVRKDGSNDNDGLTDTAAGAFLTIGKAVQVVGNLDLGTHLVTIQVGDGTWNEQVAVNAPWVGGPGSNVVFRGNLANPAACVIDSSAACFLVQNPGARADVNGFKLISGGGNGCIVVQNGGYMRLNGDMIFGTAVSSHIYVNGMSQINAFLASYRIEGGAARHLRSSGMSRVLIGGAGTTITLTGTPAFSGAFITCDNMASVETNSVAFSGSATGSRYYVAQNSVINVLGSGASYLPGSTNGQAVNGGLYV